MRTYSSSLQEERKGAYRLARFFRLVKNEYIKVFKKLSTKIMIVLIIICALGLSGIALLQSTIWRAITIQAMTQLVIISKP